MLYFFGGFVVFNLKPFRHAASVIRSCDLASLRHIVPKKTPTSTLNLIYNPTCDNILLCVSLSQGVFGLFLAAELAKADVTAKANRREAAAW